MSVPPSLISVQSMSELKHKKTKPQKRKHAEVASEEVHGWFFITPFSP